MNGGECRGTEKTRRHTGSEEKFYTRIWGLDERIRYEVDKKVKYMDVRVSKFQ